MKVFVVNASLSLPKHSVTGMMVEALVKGMQSAGAEVEVVELRKKTIRFCVGCDECHAPVPGACVIPDDMTGELYPKFFGADICVLASPVYQGFINAPLKNFLDRLTPYMSFSSASGHGWRGPHPYVVAVAPAWSRVSDPCFKVISSYFNANFGDRLIGEIYLGRSKLVPTHYRYAGFIKSYLSAVSIAGRELVKSKAISPITKTLLAKEIEDDQSIVVRNKLVWDTCVSRGVRLNEFLEGDRALYPLDAEGFELLMRIAFNQKAVTSSIVAQFEFPRSDGGIDIRTLKISPEGLEVGTVSDPSAGVVVRAAIGTYMDAFYGKRSLKSMADTGEVAIGGDSALLAGFSACFELDSRTTQVFG